MGNQPEAQLIQIEPEIELKDILDVSSIQSLMDDFYALTNIGVAVIDLHGGSFQWPRDAEAVRSITPQEFRWLLEGLSLSQPKAVKKIEIQTAL
jgi:hypothetical protein